MLARARLRWLAREGSRRAGEGDCTYSRVCKHKRSEGTKIECAGLLAEYMILAGPQSRPEGRPCCAARRAPTGRGASSGAWGVRFNLFTTEVPWVAKRSGWSVGPTPCAVGSRGALERLGSLAKHGPARTVAYRVVPFGHQGGEATLWCPADSRARSRSRGSAHCLVTRTGFGKTSLAAHQCAQLTRRSFGGALVRGALALVREAAYLRPERPSGTHKR